MASGSSHNFFSESQFFVGLCAAAMSAETYLVTGSPVNINSILVIFLAAVFIYNTSRLSLSLNKQDNATRYILQLEGSSLSITLCVIALIVLFGLLTMCSVMQLLVFMGTSLLSLLYMMPFKKNGVRLQGLRNNLVLKNIVLSITWASATVLFPISHQDFAFPGPEVIFIFLRRFFFIYALTVIYDMRDLTEDTSAGMKTIASIFGDEVTRLWSLASLAMFVLFIFIDPHLASLQQQVISGALLLSAVLAAIIILNTNRKRNKGYYSFVVDGAMTVQFLLVLVARAI